MKPNNNKHTILIVDDDDIQVNLVSQILGQDATYELITATNGEEALRLAEMYIPSIIVSDYYMPGMNGFELCKKIKQNPILRESMFILLTSATSVQDKVSGLEVGADEFISKPVHPDELFSRVRASVRIVALQNALKLEKEKLAEVNQMLEESYYGMLDLLAILVSLHVPEAFKRAERGVQFVQWCSEKLDMSREEMQVIQSAVVLHEIGKISLPVELADQEVKFLDNKERQQYPLAGQALLSRVPKLHDVALLIRYQLENFDGTGFPDHLISAEIPFGARILRAVNFLEHLGIDIAEREQLIEAIQKVKGTVLDPTIVQLLEEYIRVVGDKDWIIGKRSITVAELLPGMKLAADLSTGSGTKLLPKETVVTQFHIDRISTHHQLDPIVGSIYVYE